MKGARIDGHRICVRVPQFTVIETEADLVAEHDRFGSAAEDGIIRKPIVMIMAMGNARSVDKIGIL